MLLDDMANGGLLQMLCSRYNKSIEYFASSSIELDSLSLSFSLVARHLKSIVFYNQGVSALPVEVSARAVLKSENPA